ncbi:hypothetical protein [Pseudoxanthomonas sp. CF125]|uniref:M61 family metallopeptidase n=1 Tax=Pseudoxanthomonas sp. CF125 TaxID=1855303 RepID=UPI0008861067|nr:hypothetical protein [Pseudoxanthomonas sp. CF125]SDQ62026.1 M61 glycyl aminopeptidase [Pseudoxanthomonas sp. CF125]
MRIWLLSLFLLPTTCLAATHTRVLQAGDTRLRVEIVDEDDPARLRMLQRWIEEAADAAKTRSGRFPLRDAYVRIQQTDSDDDSPVPWGQTRRRGETGVLLYVRRDASYEQLRADWTAVHELSHLFHPYLGDSGRWLAEGLASYYQNVARARAGMLNEEEAWRRLDAGFRRGEAAATSARLDAMGRGRGGTMRVYWAGAAYWLEADLALRRGSGTTLDAILDRYAECCLRGTDSVMPQDFAAALDNLAGNDTFSALYRRYAAMRGFPSLDDAYAQLGISRNGDGLAFSGDAKARQLRDAIMAPRQQSSSTRWAAPASSPSRP